MSAPTPTPKGAPSAAAAGGDAAWTVARLLQSMQKFFAGRGIDSARLDAEMLLGHVLGRSRIYLYTHFDQPLTGPERDTLRALTRRRGAHEPIAYLLGSREFFGRDFAVDARVLIPRPETEHVVEAALAWLQQAGPAAPRICDVGTGSGAIAVTLACECPTAQVVAIDCSAEALQVAAANAQALGVADRVTFVQADVFAPVPGTDAAARAAIEQPFDVIVSNPPYIESASIATLQPDVRAFEPHLALGGGADGLDVLRRLARDVPRRLQPRGFVALEVGAGQAPAVQALLQPWCRGSARLRDLANIERVVAGWNHDGFALSHLPFVPSSAVDPPDAKAEAEAGSEGTGDDPQGMLRD